jgi:hypothetical protein
MLTLSSPANDLASAPFDRSNTPGRPAAGAAPPAAVDAKTTAAPAQADTKIPDVMRTLSAAAAFNAALGSAPATLALMADIAVASGSGTLSDEERDQLQAQYSQLTQQVAGMVSGAGAGAQSGAPSDSDDGGAARRQGGDDPSLPSPRTDEQPAQYVHKDGPEQVVTTTRATATEVVQAADAPAPRVSAQAHSLHVGVDSYEPVTVRQTQTHSTHPATFAQVAQETTTQRVRTEQVIRITQLSQVAETSQVSVVA